MTIPVLTFVAFFASILAVYWVFVLKPEAQAEGRVRRRLSPRESVKVSVEAGLLKQRQVRSALKPLNAFLSRDGAGVTRLQRLIDQSGWSTTVGTVLAASALLALVAGAVAVRYTGWVVVGVVAAAAAAVVPVAGLRRLGVLRRRRIEEQLPECLDLLSRAMRAGHAFTTGLEMVATEVPSPSREEFRLLFDRQHYGMPLPEALKAFADRVGVLDARFFVTAVLIQREAGGNLAEVLDNLSRVIRERFRVKRQIAVISAHGRITGWVLVALPPTLGAALMAANPEHRQLMFGETLGMQMMVGAAVLQVVGALIIRMIIDVEY
jgi:tight adherence protein B